MNGPDCNSCPVLEVGESATMLIFDTLIPLTDAPVESTPSTWIDQPPLKSKSCGIPTLIF